MDYEREFVNMSCKGTCSLPDLFCNMFECDRCNFWFHEICGESDKIDSEKMFCNKCKNLSSRRTIRKPKVMDL